MCDDHSAASQPGPLLMSPDSGAPPSPGVRQLHLGDADISPTCPALLVQAGSAEELGITVAKYFHHVRRWDIPARLYAVLPPATREALGEAAEIYRVPVPSRDATAVEVLLVPMHLHTGADYDLDDDALSVYHDAAGLSLPPEAIGSVLVSEAWVAPHPPGDPRSATDGSDAQETRLVCVTGTSGTSLVSQVRGAQPSPVGAVSNAATLMRPLLALQVAGLPRQARPAGDADLGIPRSLLWSGVEEWLAELLLAAVAGEDADRRLRNGDVPSLVTDATETISRELLESYAASLLGADLCAAVAPAGDTPPLVLTDALLAWLTAPIAVALVEVRPGASDLGQVDTYFRQLVVLHDRVVHRRDELIAAGVPLDGELAGESTADATWLLANRLSALPSPTELALPPVLADAFDDGVLHGLGADVDALIATAVAVYEQVWATTTAWLAQLTGYDPGQR